MFGGCLEFNVLSLGDESLFSLGVSGDCVLSLWLRRIDQSTQTDVTQLCLRNRKSGTLSVEGSERAEVPALSLHRLSMAPDSGHMQMAMGLLTNTKLMRKMPDDLSSPLPPAPCFQSGVCFFITSSCLGLGLS